MDKILIVVDMQNDFLTGSLANESAVAIIPNIKREIESGNYDHIIFTRDTHDSNYLNTQEGQRLPIIHCLVGEWGWRVCDELMTLVSDKNIPHQCLNKITFGETSEGWEKFFKTIMRLDGNDCEFIFTGTCTNICVVSNALAIKSTFSKAPVKCIADCCAPLFGDPKRQEAAFTIMESCQIDVVR